MLTLHGEPFWANQIVRQPDGSVSLVLGELDPVYQMKVNLTATLHPGIAALEISVFCYNTREARMPQMLWINTAIDATPKTRVYLPDEPNCRAHDRRYRRLAAVQRHRL